MRTSTILFLLVLIWPLYGNAEDKVIYSANTPNIMMVMVSKEIEKITEPRWRNNAYRDLAESMAFHDNIDGAIALVDKIDNADTQAMTIRAIGMVLAIHKNLSDTEYKEIFKKLDTKALVINDEGARDIAYTYIAMAQAFAGLDDDATRTTDAMVNPALKHKAFGETAEIQAERGDFDAAMASINLIDSTAFKNKALGIVSDIFVKKDELDNAFNVSQNITNPTKKAAALQKIINAKIGLDEVAK